MAYDEWRRLSQVIGNDGMDRQKFPEKFFNPDLDFFDNMGEVVTKALGGPEPSGVDVPVLGLVLAVQPIGTPALGGKIYKTSLSQKTNLNKACLQVWVRTPFDKTAILPRNILTPGKEDWDNIRDHYLYETVEEKFVKNPPSAGDWVRVIHPWADGWRNKIGEYLGFVIAGKPLSYTSAMETFISAKQNEKCKTKKSPPQELGGASAIPSGVDYSGTNIG